MSAKKPRDRDAVTRSETRAFGPRKLLVAAVGLATVNYVVVACHNDQPPTSGNLPAPTDTPVGNLAAPIVDAAPEPTSTPPVVGNLPAPVPIDAAAPKEPVTDGPPTIKDAGIAPRRPPTSGNLPAPHFRDAGNPVK